MNPDEVDKRVSELLERLIYALESIADNYAKSAQVQTDALKLSQDALDRLKEQNQ